MAGEKIKRTGSISAHNNMTGRESPPDRTVAATRSGGQAGDSGGDSRRSDAYAPSMSREKAMAHELQGLLNMLEESNRKIGEEADMAKPDVDRDPTPSLLGMSVSAGTARLKAAGLRISRLTRQVHPQVPAGHIIGQIPGPGASAPRSLGVHLIVSTGPDLLGKAPGTTQSIQG